MAKAPWRRQGRAPEGPPSGYTPEISFDQGTFGGEPSPQTEYRAEAEFERGSDTHFVDTGFDTGYGSGFDTGFDTDDGIASVATVARPVTSPVWILAVTGAAGALALLLALLLGHVVPVAFLAWAVGGPVAILVYGMFLAKDSDARGVVGYTYPEWLTSARYAALVVAGLGILAASWRIGEWAGRL